MELEGKKKGWEEKYHEIRSVLKKILKGKSISPTELNDEELARIINDSQNGKDDLLTINAINAGYKSTEHEIRFLKRVMKESPFAMWISDAKGTVMFTNETLQKILNLTDEQIIGKYNILQDENLKEQGVMHLAQSVFTDLKPVSFIIYWEGEKVKNSDFKGATPLWIDVSMYPIKDKKGKLSNVVCQWADITELKLAEKEIQEKSNFLDKIIESAALPMWISDESGTAIRINQSCLEFFGAVKEEVIGKYNLFQDSVLIENGFIPEIKKVFEKSEIVSFIIDYDFKKVDHVDVKNATHKIVHGIFTPVINTEGIVTNVIVQTIDLTEIKKTEKQLTDSEKKYKSLFNNIQEGVALHKMIFDKENKPIDFIFVDCNPMYEKLTKLKKSEIIGKKGTEVIPVLEKKWIDFYGRITLSGKPETIIDHSEYLNKYWEVKAFSPQKNHFAVAMTDVTDNITTEKALKESETLLKQAQVVASMGSWYWNLATGESRWSEELYKIYNRKPELGPPNPENWLDDIHIDDREMLTRAIDDAINKKKDYDVIYRIVIKGKKNKVKWIHTKADLKRDKNGNTISMLGTVQDITKQKIAELTQKETEEKFRFAMQAAQEGLWDWDIKTNNVYYSPGWAEILNEENVENNFSTWGSRIHPNEMDEALKSVQDHLDGKTSHWSLEHRLKTKDGTYKYVMGRGKVVEKDKNNNPTRMIGTMFDISERKLHEEKLRKQNEFIQTVLDNLPIGLATNEINEGTALYMNQKFEEIYGWPRAELLDVNKFLENIYPDTDYREKITKQILNDLQSGDPKKMHWENIMVTGKNGSKKYVNAVNIPLFEQNIMVSTVMDITDLKKTQDELQNHKDQLEELVKERTRELEEKNRQLEEKIKEVEKMNQLFVGREFRIKELKDKIKELQNIIP